MISGVRASLTRIEFDLVDDAEHMAALNHVRQFIFHIVAQIVEAELVVGAVGNVGAIGGPALFVVEIVDDDADAEAEKLVDAAHPVGVAAGEIIIDGDDVDAFAGERVEIARKGGDEGLAFAGPHLGDGAFVQHHAADELHIEMALAERALGRLADGRKSRHQNFIERAAAGELGTERLGTRAQFVVGELGDFGFERIDGGDFRAIGPETAIVRAAENPFREGGEHPKTFLSRPTARRRRLCRGTKSAARAAAAGFLPDPKGDAKPRPSRYLARDFPNPVATTTRKTVREIRVGVHLVNLASRRVRKVARRHKFNEIAPRSAARRRHPSSSRDPEHHDDISRQDPVLQHGRRVRPGFLASGRRRRSLPGSMAW